MPEIEEKLMKSFHERQMEYQDYLDKRPKEIEEGN